MGFLLPSNNIFTWSGCISIFFNLKSFSNRNDFNYCENFNLECALEQLPQAPRFLLWQVISYYHQINNLNNVIVSYDYAIFNKIINLINPNQFDNSINFITDI